MVMDRYTSNKISRLSIIMAMMVVFLHSYSRQVATMKIGSFSWWIQDIVSQGLTRVAVPYFLVVFGWLLFKDWDFDVREYDKVWAWWKMKVQKRIRSLVVPYFLWCVIGLLSTFLLTRFADTQILDFKWQNFQWWLSVMGITSEPRFAFHLWFVKTIFLCVLFAPLIGGIFYALPATSLVVVFVFSLLCDSSSSLMYVSIGALMARETFLDKLRYNGGVTLMMVLFWLLLVIGKVALTRIGMIDLYGALAISVNVKLQLMILINLFGLIAIWNLYDVVVANVRARVLWDWDRIAPLAFFVYCVHWVIQYWVSGCVGRCLSILGGNDFLMWVIPPLLTLCLSICIAMYLKRYFTQVYAILNGGR